jgi:hypothetical protein
VRLPETTSGGGLLLASQCSTRIEDPSGYVRAKVALSGRTLTFCSERHRRKTNLWRSVPGDAFHRRCFRVGEAEVTIVAVVLIPESVPAGVYVSDVFVRLKWFYYVNEIIILWSIRICQ